MPQPVSERGHGAAASPLYEVIYDVLRKHIRDGAFPPGLVLGETGVARAFGASRVPAATALRRLYEEGLVRDFNGRGYLVPGNDRAKPIRLDLSKAGLKLPLALAGSPTPRNRHMLIYPQVEHDIAACLSYGRFLVNESALAEHFGVSRTVAHEVLTKIERTGLISRDSNRRWYAGPLDEQLLSEHYEMRWLLEPIALGQVAAGIDKAEIEEKNRRALSARDGASPPDVLERLEHDLHVDIVLRCPSQQLRETIRRSQLPLIATHSTFATNQSKAEVATMIAEHLEILGCLQAGRDRHAAAALQAHLRRSLGSNLELLRRLHPPPDGYLPPYLAPMPS